MKKMKKIVALASGTAAAAAALPVSAAVFMEPGTYDSMGSACGGMFFMMPLIGIVFCALASFVFSLIFWLVYRWLIKK